MVGQTSISPVSRSKEDARVFYDRISGAYDWVGGFFERKPAVRALDQLGLRSGQRVLEIGFGTGYCLQQIASRVGSNGAVCGLDISGGMIRQARERLAKNSLSGRAGLCQGDAARLPFDEEIFDAVFISFTLELFDTPEIPQVLAEIGRVLKPDGSLCAVSLSKTRPDSFAIRSYERVHSLWPAYVDCRPIYLENSLQRAGFNILLKETLRLLFLPVDIVVAARNK